MQEVESGGGTCIQRVESTYHIHWYRLFRLFKARALDLRRSSNSSKSRKVAASVEGWNEGELDDRKREPEFVRM
jgi:hypothetical protein